MLMKKMGKKEKKWFHSSVNKCFLWEGILYNLNIAKKSPE